MPLEMLAPTIPQTENSRLSMSSSIPPVVEEVKVYIFWDGFKEMVIYGPFNILLFAVPIAFISESVGLSPAVTFIFSLLALAPLAERLGYVTEQLAMHTNDTVGGLLNVTFGNATELIVAILALFKGLYRVVQLTLLGSVLSNLLLVLGTTLLVGGFRYEKQTFNSIMMESNAPLLLVSSSAVLFSSTLSISKLVSTQEELSASRCASLFLFLLYGFYIYFQVHYIAYVTNFSSSLIICGACR